MNRVLLASAPLLLIVGLLVFPVTADQRLVRFNGGIGSQPLRSGPAVNVVNGVNPGGVPWVIADLKAEVKVDGAIRVDGRGLLLAGTNNIGRNGGQSVRARLFCGGVAHDTAVVPLDEAGDFRIEDVLNPVPPNPCEGAVLLIVSAGNAWFAAGIPVN